MAEYKNIEDELHTAVYNIIKNDPDISSYTTNIYDGIPVQLRRGTGFPYIIVHTPTVREDQITVTKSMVDSTIQTEIIDKKESNVRILVGLVRHALKINRVTLRGNTFYLYNIGRTNLNRTIVSDEKRIPVWYITLFASFRGVYE